MINIISQGLYWLVKSYIFYNTLNYNTIKNLKLKENIIKSFPFVIILFIFSIFFNIGSLKYVLPMVFLLFMLFYILKNKRLRLNLCYNLSLVMFTDGICILSMVFIKCIIFLLFNFINKNINMNELLFEILIEGSSIFIYYFIIIKFWKMLLKSVYKIRKIIAKSKLMFIIIISVWWFIVILRIYIYLAEQKYYQFSISIIIIFILLFFAEILLIKIGITAYDMFAERRAVSEKEKIISSLDKLSYIKDTGSEISEEISSFSSLQNKYGRKDWEIFSEYLNKINIKLRTKGANQLIMSLILVKYSNKDKVDLKNDIYTKVAKETNSKSAKNVARNIDNAIKSAWVSANPEDLLREYTRSINPDKGAPTNSEFIMYVVEKLKNEKES